MRTGKERGGKEAKEAEPPGPRKFTAEETVYSQHPWNINNMPRCKARLLARNELRYRLKLKPNEDLCGHQKLCQFWLKRAFVHSRIMSLMSKPIAPVYVTAAWYSGC